MRALTIRQPWAWALFHGKDVENRTRMFSYRGKVLIHAGASYAGTDALAEVERLQPAPVPLAGHPGVPTEIAYAAVIGVAVLADAHRWEACRGSCSPWAQPGQVHHVLTNPRALTRPVPAHGRLGLWVPDVDLLNEVGKALP